MSESHHRRDGFRAQSCSAAAIAAAPAAGLGRTFQSTPMDINFITDAIRRDLYPVVFFNVLLQQAGLPIPVVPTLMIAGSLVASPQQAVQILAVAMVAALLADSGWYAAGRAFGYRILSGLCRLSINPGSCVTETESRFVRWGVWSLIIAKFVPGFSMVAPPIAGALRMRFASFLMATGLGGLLWAGAAVVAGVLFRREVGAAIDALGRNGATALMAVAAIVGFTVGWKLWRKYRFVQMAAMPRITAEALSAALDKGVPLLLLDLRGEAQVALTGPLDGFTPARIETLAQAVAGWPRHQDVVTLCACPQDAGAVRAADRLSKMGYTAVRPLDGGYESWMRHLEGDESAAHTPEAA
jgi:membrane protein DedA with SNARE-associated domain/rhodanese-related sulfurtransferase